MASHARWTRQRSARCIRTGQALLSVRSEPGGPMQGAASLNETESSMSVSFELADRASALLARVRSCINSAVPHRPTFPAAATARVSALAAAHDRRGSRYKI
jgi:hypothetical protein